MDKQKSIALVLATLALFLCVCVADMFFGPRPEIARGYEVAGVLLIASITWVSWTGYLRLKETKAEAEEYEQAFVEEVEREFLGGGASDFGAAVAEGAGGMSVARGERDNRENGDARDILGDRESNDSGGTCGLGVSPKIRGADSGAGFPPGAPAGITVSSVAETPPASPVQGAAFGVPSFAPAIEQLATNLKQLGVIDTYEGKVDLPPPAPPAPIYHLRTGGLILLLEDWENHRFLEFQSRRFRAIVVCGADGKPMVIRRFQDFVTDELESPKENRA